MLKLRLRRELKAHKAKRLEATMLQNVKKVLANTDQKLIVMVRN